VDYNKRRLHKGGYFEDLLSTNKEVNQSMRPLLKLSRETIDHSQRLDYALVSSLERDPLLAERLKRLRTVPGVGPFTALTWALEIGDFTRFPSVKEAISYCGLCGDESSSADKVLRMPLSKQRNKHIQRTLIEAAKLAIRYNHELAEVYEKEGQRGNANRATLAVARKLVAYLLRWTARSRISCLPRYSKLPRQRKNLPKKEGHQDNSGAQAARSRRLATERRKSNSRGSLRIVSGLAENTNSIFCADSSESWAANRCPVLRDAGTISREALLRVGRF
jgi:hypothetical protein